MFQMLLFPPRVRGDGLTNELMDMGHIVRLMDQAEEAPKKRRPYRKKAAQMLKP
jgi:hypothetical protein